MIGARNSENLIIIFTQRWRFDELGAIDVPFVHMMNAAELAIAEPRGLEHWPMVDALLVAVFLFADEVVDSDEELDCTVDLHGWLTRGQVAINRLDSKVVNANMVKLFKLEGAKQVLLWSVHPDWVDLPKSRAGDL